MKNIGINPSRSFVSSTLSKACGAILGVSLLMGATAAMAQESSTLLIRGKEGWLFPRWGSLTTVDNTGIDNATNLIAQANKILAAKGIKLELLLLPDKVRFYQDKLPDGEAMSPQVQQRYSQILGKLQQSGVSTFDAEAAMRKVQQAGQDVYYRTDQHWTQPAADATADATAALIKQDVPQLAGQAGSGKALGAPVKDRRYGDLADLFLSSDEKKQLGRDTFAVRREAQSAGLLDDAPAPVHVTGHSMMQPYFGFPQKLSNVLDRPVSLNWKPGNVGPWVMMLEYVESPAFKQHKPQVLVWQMFEPSYAQGPNAKGLWDNASIMTDETWLSRFKAAVGG